MTDSLRLHLNELNSTFWQQISMSACEINPKIKNKISFFRAFSPLAALTLNLSLRRDSSGSKLHFTSSYKACREENPHFYHSKILLCPSSALRKSLAVIKINLNKDQIKNKLLEWTRCNLRCICCDSISKKIPKQSNFFIHYTYL